MRYVKEADGFWHYDRASYGKDSGTSYADMFGGADVFYQVVEASAPLGVDTSGGNKASVDEDAAYEEVYLKLKADYASRGLSV